MTCFSLAETGATGTWLSEELCIHVCNLAAKNKTRHLKECEPRRRTLVGQLGVLGPTSGSVPSAG